MRRLDRVSIGIAGLLGASGVAAAAASSHAEAELLGPYALVALTHAPALLALASHAPRGRTFDLAKMALAAGAVVFCADIASRHVLGFAPMRFAAPLGGMAMIVGWLCVMAGAVMPARR